MKEYNNISDEKTTKTNINWVMLVYGNTIKNLDISTFFEKCILHILSFFNKNNVIIEIISNN